MCKCYTFNNRLQSKIYIHNSKDFRHACHSTRLTLGGPVITEGTSFWLPDLGLVDDHVEMEGAMKLTHILTIKNHTEYVPT